jgi:small-conductance mechanosensitive channel
MEPWMRSSLEIAGIMLAALAIAVVVHLAATRLVARFVADDGHRPDSIVMIRLRRPVLWILIAVAESIALRAAPLGPGTIAIANEITGLVAPAFAGWLALALLNLGHDILNARSDIDAPDNLAARRRRTRTDILARIGAVVIVFTTVCMMLLSIPGVRSVGLTLMASAGLAGLAVGAAAQPALKNIIAGIQMAVSEPIRIDDVVIIDGEWGRIEEIRLTFVVVRIWDERRLIVPVSRFLEASFQNWTRESSALIGTALLYVDPATNVVKVRDKLDTVVRANPKWDGRVLGLQVTDIRPDVMELRVLVSAADAGRAFDLRCDVREAMMAFVAADMPEALPRRRTQVSGQLSAAPAG